MSLPILVSSCSSRNVFVGGGALETGNPEFVGILACRKFSVCACNRKQGIRKSVLPSLQDQSRPRRIIRPLAV